MRADDPDGPLPAAGVAVVAVLGALAADLAAALQAAARDEADAVHQARILVRRLRSVLGATRKFFGADAVQPLRAALAELGDALGEVRDLEVRVEKAEGRVSADAPAPLRRRLIDEERERHDARQRELGAALGEEVDATVALAEFLGDPPYAVRAATSPREALSRVLRRELRRTRRTVEASAGDLDSLHRLRRAARRLRYTAEAVSTPPLELFGADVGELAAAAHEVQDLLGDHRDEVLFAHQVRRAAQDAEAAGESSEAYAAIAAESLFAAEERLQGLPAAISRLNDAASGVTQHG